MIETTVDFELLGDKSILCVEDDSFNQELASAVFDEYQNIKIIQASNGKEAIDILKSQKVDLILLDLMMPQMDGFETLKILKSSDKFRDISVIIVTSKESEEIATYQLGADDFILKPYNPHELRLRTFKSFRVSYFHKLLEDIKINSNTPKASSTQNFNNIREAIDIAIRYQKDLLSHFANILDRDKNSIIRLREYIILFAKLNGLTKKEIDDISYIIYIYDIGLLAIERQKLINLDKKAYLSHTLLGFKLLEKIEQTNIIKVAKDVAYSHHENWNGKGYPDGLKADEIPFYARLVSIIDYFDELTTSRSYDKNYISTQKALEVIKREREVKFDPNLVDIFIANFTQFEDIRDRF